jgi:glycosyltransferase involved in cell wall biosynthesis
MVLLIGNYPADQQQSMQRFAMMMLRGLTAAGVAADLIVPEPCFGRFRNGRGLIAKWLGYIDKFVLFPRRLRAKLAERPALVHICDHSNAVYDSHVRHAPVVVTCHDLLAVRGALGEETDCPATFTGKFLQRWILRGLQRAAAVACVSHATQADAQRLINPHGGSPRIEVIKLGLNYPYRKLPQEELSTRLAKVPGWEADQPFVLHVGSNSRRKNRDGVLRIFAWCKDQWGGRLVLAGEPLNSGLLSLAGSLGISDRITQLENPGSELLEALYNYAVALLYPSRFEGFGWPVIEAHACGCPVICGNSGPLPEVAGQAGLFHHVSDEEGFAMDLLRLTNPAERERWSEKSLRNAARFDTKKMIAQYLEIYRSLAPQL